MHLYCDQIKQNNDMDTSLEQLKAQETKLYNQIYECVETEQAQSIHMIDQITALTEQLLVTKSRINELEHNQKITQAEIIYLSNLPNILNNIKDFDPDTERIEFRDDIFEKLFKSIEIFNNSTIRCNLVFNYDKTIVLTETNLHKLKVKHVT